MRKILTGIASVLATASLIVPFSVAATVPIGFAYKDKDGVILYDEPTVATAPAIVDAEAIMPMDIQEKIAGEPMDSTITTAMTTTTTTTTATKSEIEQLKEKVAKLERENKALKEENEKLKKEKESLKELIQKIKTAFGL